MKYIIFMFLFSLGASIQSYSQQTLKTRFSHPGIIRYDHNTFIINGKDTFIYSGSFHYTRCDPVQWTGILQKIKAAGFNTIESYVPWNFHEQTEGKITLTLLDKFLDDCQRMGLYVIIRPGPYICAEWDVGGFPRWLAGKGIGFRTPSQQDIYWSRYWYNEVLPVIRRHLITNGGTIILLQIENEYDFFGLPDSAKVKYLKSLYHDAIQNGIDVPVITCWTKQARDNTDSVFSQIMDAVNGYPSWNIDAILPRIEAVKKQEPDSPPFFTELQGGWFTGIGDKMVRNIYKYGAGQINALTKYVIAHGIKGLNYYMLYGGTNFGYWAGKGKTTSYDYTAPISECGGLWSKYYAVKLIGDFLKYSRPYLSLSHEVENGATANNLEIETLLRSDGRVGFVFVRNKTKKMQNADINVKMPGNSPLNISVSVDSLGAYFLPVNLPIPGGSLLHYSNVQISTVTEFNGKPLLIAYGFPGEKAVIDWGQKVFTGSITSNDRLYPWNGSYILLTSRSRAAREVLFDTKKDPAVLLSDSYLTIPDTRDGNLIKLQTRPGKDNFSLIVTGGVSQITLDGKPVKYTNSQSQDIINFSLNTPDFSKPEVKFGQVRYKNDADAENSSFFKPVPYKDGICLSLDSLGNYRDGYSVYKGKFELSGSSILKVGYYTNDWHSVYIDGKPVKGLTGNSFQDRAAVKLSNDIHDIKIFYENEGRPNTGYMEEGKGLKFIHVMSPEQIRTLQDWKYNIQETEPSNAAPAEAGINFNDSGWKSVEIGGREVERTNDKQVGSWYRKIINLTADEASDNPRLIFEGISRSAVIYVNGNPVFNFRHHGWDAPFNVSLNGAVKAGKNLVVLYVMNFRGRGGIVGPVEFEYGKEEPLKFSQLTFHPSLNGEIAGWQKTDYNDSGWKTLSKPDGSGPANGIRWYRTWFTVPSYKNWEVPWHLHLESTGNLQIWLNGKLLGRYYAVGPQENFYLPKGWLKIGEKNSLVLVMRPSGKGNVRPVLKEFSVSPYSEYVVQKHELIIKQ